MAVDVEQLYLKYGPMVLRRCRALLGDEDAALDAMQDVFVKVLARKGRIRDEGLSSFLYVTATNTCLNVLRRGARRAGTAGDEWLETLASGEDMESRSLDRIFLEDLFRDHPDSTRTMAVLHYRDGLTLEETAEATGLSVSGVRKRLRKLRAAGLALAKGGGDEG